MSTDRKGRQYSFYDLEDMTLKGDFAIREGDVYLYEFPSAVDSQKRTQGLVVLDFFNNSIQVASCQLSPFDALEMVYHLCEELEIPMVALRSFEEIQRKARKVKASKGKPNPIERLKELLDVLDE